MMSRFCSRAIQSPVDELGEAARLSRPRAAFVSISSMAAFCLEPGELRAADEPLVLALDGLAIDEQAEPLLEGQRGDIGLQALLFERLRHAGEAEGQQAVVSWMREHVSCPFVCPLGVSPVAVRASR